jgi:hypothetical protein
VRGGNEARTPFPNVNPAVPQECEEEPGEFEIQRADEEERGEVWHLEGCAHQRIRDRARSSSRFYRRVRVGAVDLPGRVARALLSRQRARVDAGQRCPQKTSPRPSGNEASPYNHVPPSNASMYSALPAIAPIGIPPPITFP